MTVSDIKNELEDNSTYSKFLALYTRDSEFNLLSSSAKGGFALSKYWGQLTNEVMKTMSSTYGSHQKYHKTSISVALLPKDCIPSRWFGCDSLNIMEYFKSREKQVRGIVVASYDADYPHLTEFHQYFCEIILRDSRVHFSTVKPVFDEDAAIAAAVAGFFSYTLKNKIKEGDRWDECGRDHFIEELTYFTKRNLRIEAVLPAFPCKSPNMGKVYSTEPDRGEELAIRRLIQVTRAIKAVYPPGMKLFIVSDGHVFSDCISVDDDKVDVYTEELKMLFKAIANSEGVEDEDLIGFVSLKDMFFNKDGTFTPSLVDQVELEHHTESKICFDAEISRKMMMAACDTDAGKLREELKTNGPRTDLYRGFSKFMEEDLKTLARGSASRKSLKKLASKVAFEMIKRNDAYSNLVELMFPFHMRLSIHAHHNGGPKFGIRLVNPLKGRLLCRLGSDKEPDFDDLLHIPTPWHNTIVYIEGEDFYYMTKSHVVTDALENGHYTGHWVPSKLEEGIGGHFVIKKNWVAGETPEMSSESESFDGLSIQSVERQETPSDELTEKQAMFTNGESGA